MAILENDDTLNKEINKYNDFIPVNLSDIKRMKGYEYSFKDIAYDPRGEKYDDVLVLEKGDNSYIEFYTGSQYSTFKCQIVPSSDFGTGRFYGSYVKIYSDDTLIYTSDKVDYKTKPFEVELDIKNAEYFTIKLEAYDRSEPFDIDTLLVEPRLYK